MNTQAQTALAAAIAAIAVAVADIGKAIAGHPATQADDSGQILKAAEELQGMAGQLETIATQVAPPAPEGANDGGVTGAEGAGDNGGSSSATAGAGTADAGTADAGTVTEPVAPEAGSTEGPGTLEPGPETVAEDPANQPEQPGS